MRVGDPALMLLRPEAQFDPETERLIRADILRALPDPTTGWNAPNGRLWGSVATLELRRSLAIASAKLDRHRAEQTKNEAME